MYGQSSHQNSGVNLPSSLQPNSGQAPNRQSYMHLDINQLDPPPPSHINTNQQQYTTLPTRSNTMSNNQGQPSHSYSRSSPAGLQDHKYIPFSASSSSNQPDLPPPKYPQTPQQRNYAPLTPGAGPSHSPLVLDQIRPRANSTLNDEFHAYGDLQATNSNYVAPWAVFAFDWCKYPTLGGNSAGKMAIGSYLEDPHNFVSRLETVNCDCDSTDKCRYKSSTLK